ncbi:MAG: hypothetical protein ACKVQK_26655, partial [Burkholderiales bacterium]
MTAIEEYFKYATLATASYVRLGTDVTQSIDPVIGGARFARLAREQDRIPSELGNFYFDSANSYGAPVWKISSYYGGDLPANQDQQAASDKSGFGATLFERAGEKVLAMRGTESGEDQRVDLLSADLGQIGFLGLALTQVVSMANYVMRLRGVGTNVRQLKVEASLELPLTSNSFLRAAGDSLLNAPYVYFIFSEAERATGLGKIQAGDSVSLTGHSLGGHLAYIAARLFPDIFDSRATVFNSAGYDPSTANLVELIGLLGGPLGIVSAGVAAIFKEGIAQELGPAANRLETHANQFATQSVEKIRSVLFPGEAFVQGVPDVVSIRSEDLYLGDDLSLVASRATGADKYGAPIELPTEENNHVIEPFMDALALGALI